MSIHFTSFNVFFRKITHFRYKDFAEEGKKRTCPHEVRAAKIFSSSNWNLSDFLPFCIF